MVILLLVSVLAIRTTAAAVDCTAVTALITPCSTFISFGSPEPVLDSTCCDAVAAMNAIADSPDNRRGVCRCLMGLITEYSPTATAIAALPGLCGVSLGFAIHPNTDCTA